LALVCVTHPLSLCASSIFARTHQQERHAGLGSRD
jgi:hypothetical protein